MCDVSLAIQTSRNLKVRLFSFTNLLPLRVRVAMAAQLPAPPCIQQSENEQGNRVWSEHMTIGLILTLAVTYFAGMTAGVSMMETSISQKHVKRLKLLRHRLMWIRQNRNHQSCCCNGNETYVAKVLGNVRTFSAAIPVNLDLRK